MIEKRRSLRRSNKKAKSIYKLTKTQCVCTVFLCFNSHLNDNSNSFIIWFGRKEDSFYLPLFSIDYDILSHFQFVTTVHNTSGSPWGMKYFCWFQLKHRNTPNSFSHWNTTRCFYCFRFILCMILLTHSHSLLGIIFNGFCFINLIPHFFDYLMCPYYPALYDGLLSNCYRWW